MENFITLQTKITDFADILFPTRIFQTNKSETEKHTYHYFSFISISRIYRRNKNTAFVSGEVSRSDGEPAERLFRVFIEDTPYGTTTDRYGKFKMQAPTGKTTLVFNSFRAHRCGSAIEVVADTENHYTMTHNWLLKLPNSWEKWLVYRTVFPHIIAQLTVQR